MISQPFSVNPVSSSSLISQPALRSDLLHTSTNGSFPTGGFDSLLNRSAVAAYHAGSIHDEQISRRSSHIRHADLQKFIFTSQIPENQCQRLSIDCKLFLIDLYLDRGVAFFRENSFSQSAPRNCFSDGEGAEHAYFFLEHENIFLWLSTCPGAVEWHDAKSDVVNQFLILLFQASEFSYSRIFGCRIKYRGPG